MDRLNEPRDLIQSLWRGMQLLELLADAPEGLLAKTLSQRSHLNLSTCYHLLNTLVAAGYVAKDSASQRFMLTGKIIYPRRAVMGGAWLVPHLQSHLQALRDATREAAYLSLRENGEIIVSMIIECPQALRVSLLHVGYDKANHCTALGKAVLAYMDDQDVASYFARHGMPALTPNTITDLDSLKRELAAVRARGYSLDHEEFALGVCCIGAPIFGITGQVIGSVAISLPTSRYRIGYTSLVEHVLTTARAASRTAALLSYVEADADGNHDNYRSAA